MGKGKIQILNPETLRVEEKDIRDFHVEKTVAILVTAVLLFVGFIWIWGSNPDLVLPKTMILRRRSATWDSRLEVLSGRMDKYEAELSMLEVRDDKIYRSVYGMNEIPFDIRSSVNPSSPRYAAIADLDKDSRLRAVTLRMDSLMKRAAVQSKSFDEIEVIARTTGEMATSIPSICPLTPGSFHLSSPFGTRSDPFNGTSKRHTGMDFSCPIGTPIYASGDGVVVKVAHEFYGYGNSIMVDHGFGYRTRYAHMSKICVRNGQVLRRGDFLGYSGRSGRATGPHLHYEVFYRNDYVNPYHFMDLELSEEDYAAMVRMPEEIIEDGEEAGPNDG